jgi:hypothetical protein
MRYFFVFLLGWLVAAMLLLHERDWLVVIICCGRFLDINLFSLVAVCCFSGVFLDGYKGLLFSSDLSIYIFFFVFAIFQHYYF